MTTQVVFQHFHFLGVAFKIAFFSAYGARRQIGSIAEKLLGKDVLLFKVSYPLKVADHVIDTTAYATCFTLTIFRTAFFVQGKGWLCIPVAMRGVVWALRGISGCINAYVL
jgi:hypothetical protein